MSKGDTLIPGGGPGPSKSGHRRVLDYSESGLHYFCAYDSAGGVTVDDTEITVPLGTTLVADSVFDLSSGEVAISERCMLEVMAVVNVRPVSSDGGSRGEIELTLQEDDGAGSWSDIAGFVARSFAWELNGTHGMPGIVPLHRIIPAWEAGESIRMRVRNYHPSMMPDQELFPGGSSLTLKVLRWL